MALSKQKQCLVKEMKDLGFSESDIDFLIKKSISWIKNEIDSEKTFRIVARGAERAGNERNN